MMSKKDAESFFRMALSRMEMAADEVDRISKEVHHDPMMECTESLLRDAIYCFSQAQEAAAELIGFNIRESMFT